MKETIRTLALALVTIAAMLLYACQNSSSTGQTAQPAESPEAQEKTSSPVEPAEGISLTPEEVEKLGIVTTEARAGTREPESAGFGVVLPHEVIAQAAADLHTAIAAERQSQSALARSRRLAGTPGAMPADVQETAERQASADRAALDLARQRLSASFGQNPPWKTAEDSSELAALASGQAKLVRVTFPLGSIGDSAPTRVLLARIEASQGDHRWRATSVWLAPADVTVPGRSFFAVLKNSTASEGEHLLAWVPQGTPESGVLIPAAAAVVSAGKFWCYIEKAPGTFVRREFDPSRPAADGYFVTNGISEGDKIVTTSAGALLARETNPSTEAE